MIPGLFGLPGLWAISIQIHGAHKDGRLESRLTREVQFLRAPKHCQNASDKSSIGP